MIILDIAFENTKEFQVELVTPGPGVNIFPYALSRIVILDYNGECQEVTGEIESCSHFMQQLSSNSQRMYLMA